MAGPLTGVGDYVHCASVAPQFLGAHAGVCSSQLGGCFTMPLAARKRLVMQPAFIGLWIASIVSVLTFSLWSCKRFSIITDHPTTSVTIVGPTAQRFQHSFGHKTSSVAAARASCKGLQNSTVSAADVLATFEEQWGAGSCVVLRNACMDEGTFVTFEDSPYSPQKVTTTGSPTSKYYDANSSTTSSSNKRFPWPQFKLGNHHLDFWGFGDVAGIIQYPAPIIRPGGPDEEPQDMRQPVTFSHCVRPVVLYLNFLYMFGDWWLRTMPAFMHAMAAGAWDRRYSIVIATGGQKLDRWQKLVLQTLTDNPVVTLSSASSRVLAEKEPAATALVAPAAPTAASASEEPSAAAAAAAVEAEQRPRTAGFASHTSSSSGPQFASQSRAHGAPQQQLVSQQQEQERSVLLRHVLQHQPQPQQLQGSAAPAAAAATSASKAASGLPVTAFGRCFELLTVCSVSDARSFPVKPKKQQHRGGGGSSRSSASSNEAGGSGDSSSVVPRETWAGAQYVKQYYMQRYGEQYHHLPQQYKKLKQPGAFRVVFAVRPAPPSPPAPAAAAAAATANGDVSVATLSGDLSSSSSSSSSRDSSSSSGRGELQDPTDVQLAASTRQLMNIDELLQWCNSWTPTAAADKDLEGIDSSSEAVAAAAAASRGSRGRFTHTVCVAYEFGRHGEIAAATAGADGSSGGDGSSWWRSKGPTTRQLQSHAASNPNLVAASASYGAGSRRLTGQQGQLQESADGSGEEQLQQQQWEDPDLDPRALMVDLAVLDHADVVVGIHGAQLYNALFMPAHKALVETRPYGFWGGWPQTYFYDPLVRVDKDDGILWFGIDTVNASNSRPGCWERQGIGVAGTYARDRHTRVEPAALELLFRRIIWSSETPAAYKELKYAGLTHITDTLQPAQQYHATLQQAQATARQQEMQQHLQRPEIAAAVQAARAATGAG